MDFLCEHVVQKKKEGLYRFRKVGIISLMVLIPTIIIIGCMALSSIEGLIFLRWSIFLIPLFVWLGLKFGPIYTAYGEVAYEYSISSGKMSVARIYGDRFRREWVEIDLTKLEACAPLEDTYNPDIENKNFARVYRAVSSINAPHIYYAVFKNGRDEDCLIYFEMIKKSYKMIKTYFPRTVSSVLPD